MTPSMTWSRPLEPYYSKAIEQKYRLGVGAGPKAHTSSKSRWAKIDYEPNWNEFLARRASRILAGGLETSVPEGWPTKLGGRIAWKGKDFADEDEFLYTLSTGEKKEIDDALKYFIG